MRIITSSNKQKRIGIDGQRIFESEYVWIGPRAFSIFSSTCYNKELKGTLRSDNSDVREKVAEK